MPDENTVTAESAARAAATEHNIPVESDEPGEVESQKVEGTKDSEAKVDVPETSESTVLDDRTTKALRLLDQLEDATNGPELVRAMAKQIGLIQDAPTQKVAEKAAKTLREKVQATLGEDYPILGDRIAGLLEDVLGEQESRFNHEIVSRDRARYEADVSARVDKFISSEKVTEAEQVEIQKLAVKFPPSPSVPPEEYLAYHLKVVRMEQAETKANAKTRDKIKSNLAESPANRGVAGDEERIIKAPKSLTPLQAVQMAVRGETISE